MSGGKSARGTRAEGRVLVVSTALLWGLAGVGVKSVSWGALSIVCVRSAVSLLMVLLLKRGVRLHLSRSNLLGGIAFCLTGALYVQAIKLTTAGTAIVLQNVAPILVFLYEVIFRGRKAKLWELVLTGGVFFGIVLSFADGIDMTHAAGNALALLSGVFYAAHIVLMSAPESSAEDCVVIGNVMSFLLCLPGMLLDPHLSFDAHNVLWALGIGVFQYGLPNILFARGCRLLDDVECALLLTIEPVFNPIPVAIVCGERMGTMAVIGAAVVIASVALYAAMPRLEQRWAARHGP